MKKFTFSSFILIICLVFYSSHIFPQAGALDPTFDPGTGADINIATTHIQDDGKILIGGSFIAYNGTAINRIARLNTDGSIDTTFDPGTGTDGAVSRITIQNDGRILISGSFTEYNGTPRNGIARLNPDGSLDTTFDPGQGVLGSIFTSTIQSDGKIIITGIFIEYNGIPRRGIARLNQDGSLDTTLDPGTGVGYFKAVRHSAILDDGKILIAGDFSEYNGTPRKNIALINPDGSLDFTFDPGLGANEVIFTFILKDGKIIIAGDFTSYDGNPKNYIARLNQDGSIDPTFDTGQGASTRISTLALQDDGKIIVGGNFTQYNGATKNRIVRLNQDGSFDSTFNTGTGANASVSSISIQNDNKIIIGGSFTDYNGTAINRIARINSETLSIGDWENNLENQIKIYPNPANDVVTISNIPDGSTLDILDITGKLIHSFKNIDNNSSVSTSSLVNGIYILKIENNGSVAHKKLVVKR